MYENFNEFIKNNEKLDIKSEREFLEVYNGKSFLNGLYRIHNLEDREKWNEIIGKTFPPAMGKIMVFGYDWLGRSFAIYNETDTVLMFEPGTGEAFDTDFNFYDFHNKEIPTNHLVCLASEYYEKWRKANNNYILPHNKCAGYKVPLFLNGKDVVENLEISDMEVYWEIMMPLINLLISIYGGDKMPTNQEKVSQLLADSHFAFINSQNNESLHLANEAIRLAPKNPDAYQCAGDAYMSLGQYEKAVESYKKAVKLDQNNGNRYFNLGYALATSEKAADAIKNLAKADELGCSPENTVQLYNLLGIICFDIGRYKDALVNLEKAEQIIGVDLDIMKRKVIIYGMKNDIRNGLLTTNQMKLVAPSDYTGYQLAFKLLCQANRLDAAERELEMAKKYAELSMDYYFDCMTFEIQKYQTDRDKQRYNKALTFIEEALKTLKPTSTEVIESYINAAEIYLQLEDPDKTIDCLNAAQNPAESYNLGFDVIDKEFEPVNLTEYDVEEMIEADKERIAEKYGDYGLEELAESIEPDENGAREYLTNVEDETDTEETAYKLDETEEIELTPENIDQINRLYIGAYTLKKEFNKVIDYARKLQSSESVQNSYIGIYSETNAYKELGSPETKQKYEETIRYFRNAMIKDPSDMAAVTFRIQCYMDIGQYDEAEQLCNLLANELRKPLLEKIEEARSVDS